MHRGASERAHVLNRFGVSLDMRAFALRIPSSDCKFFRLYRKAAALFFTLRSARGLLVTPLIIERMPIHRASSVCSRPMAPFRLRLSRHARLAYPLHWVFSSRTCPAGGRIRDSIAAGANASPNFP